MNRTILAIAAAFLGFLTFHASPASADDAALCTFMQQVVAGANEQSGKMIDAITRGETATIDCDAKTAAFKWTITVPASNLNQGWQDTLKGNIEKIVCADATFKEAVASGWKVTAGWKPTDTDEYVAPLTCT